MHLSSWQNIYNWWCFINHPGGRLKGFLLIYWIFFSELPLGNLWAEDSPEVVLRPHTGTYVSVWRKGTEFPSIDTHAGEEPSCCRVEPSALHLVMIPLLRHQPRHWPRYTYLDLISAPKDPKTTQEILSFQQGLSYTSALHCLKLNVPVVLQWLAIINIILLQAN